MATLHDFFFDQPVASPGAMFHLGQAVKLVNQNLQSTQGLSNPNLAVVNFLVLRELLREDRERAAIHLKGLHKMVELRGGLSQLDDDILALKFCK
jgi:hypothetical protein